MTALFTLLREKNTHQQHTSTTHINKHTSTTQKWIGPRWIGQNWLAKWAEKWIFKNTQNSTKGPPRERRKKENCGGRGKTKSDFFLRSGGEEGSRGGRGVRRSTHILDTPTKILNTTHNKHTTHTHSTQTQHKLAKILIGQILANNGFWPAKHHDGQKWIAQNWIGQSRS